MLNVKEIFLSIQGEGPYAGTPAIFIRMAGCNLSCDFCDTDHTTAAQQISVDDIVRTVALLTDQTKVNLIVITGGEPFMQIIYPLISILHEKNYVVQIETNGTICPDDLREYSRISVIVCSPKENAPVDHRIVSYMLTGKYVNAWKYLVAADTDLEELTGLPAKCTQPPQVPQGEIGAPFIFIRPLDSHDPEKNQKNIQKAVEICIRYGYQLSTQVQKYLKIQ